jgi:hypothetical protein
MLAPLLVVWTLVGVAERSLNALIAGTALNNELLL